MTSKQVLSQALWDIYTKKTVGKKEHFLGCHRALLPSETVTKARKQMPHMGITRIADVTGLDRIGIPVVMVCRPNARSLAVSQGKGLDLDSAIASGLMESIELFHAEHIDLPLKLASYAEISKSNEVIDVARLPMVSNIPFDQNVVMLWIEGLDLFTGEPRWVPFESVRTNFTLPAPPGSGYFDCSSNGLASGNTMIEAVCHGICEVIERDSTALWNQLPKGTRKRTGLDLDSVDDEACRTILSRLEDTDFDVAVWETTSDINVPSFFALLSDRRNRKNHRGIGAGTHPARNIALLRTLTEAVQVRTTYISGTRDDLAIEEYSDLHRHENELENSRLISEQITNRKFNAIESPLFDTFSEDLNWLFSRLKSVGVKEAVAIDLSKKDIGISVVRLIIPGLEGPDDHDAYVPGERARQMNGGSI